MVPVAFKLADFGISQDLSIVTSQQLMTSNIVYNRGTLSYLAPEQGVKGAKLHDVYRVEVFQLGVILFRLLFKQSPFRPSSFEDPMAKDPQFLDKFIESDMNTHKVRISQPLKDLLRGMLHSENAKRLTLNQVLDSPWFNSMRTALVNDSQLL